MRIVNFIKHDEPKRCGFNLHGKEFASFDLEFNVGEFVLLWQGWSIRQFKDYPLILQAAHMDWKTTFKKGTCVLMKGMDPSVFLARIRELISKEQGIEIPLPVRKAPQTKPKAQSESKVEEPAPPPKTVVKVDVNKLKSILQKGLEAAKKRGTDGKNPQN